MQVLWVCIGLPVLLLAAWLVRDWMDAGGSKKARKAAKALGNSRTDEMEHAISTQAQAVAYRVTQAGHPGRACICRLLVRGQPAAELCVAAGRVFGMAEVVCHAGADLPAKRGTTRSIRRDWRSPIAKLTFCAVLIGLAVGMTVLAQNW